LDVLPKAAQDDDALRVVKLAARLLLEYNARCSTLLARIRKLSDKFDLGLQVFVSYRGVNLYHSDGRAFHIQVPEYRLNVAVSSGVLRVVDAVIDGNLTPNQAIEQMQALESSGPCHKGWISLLWFGLAASALAGILQADHGTIILVGLSSALGLLVRRALGKRHWPLFSLPFIAAAIGGVVAGWATHLGWTETTGLCLIVPSLMLVPGPHLINSHFDILGNHIQTGLCRLVLAVTILLAAAFGALLGGWAVMDLGKLSGTTSSDVQLTLWLDLLLAGIAACGFGIFYNSPWRILWISIACGMIGHGVRFLCLTADTTLPSATFAACTAIGVLAGVAAMRFRLSFSSIAFAASVPMMPGLLIYRCIGGAVQFSRAGADASVQQFTLALVLLLQASLVVGAMVLGLLLGTIIASRVEASAHG
jgi:uncharacterized membrane protein YjjP (DUF1212 family)